MNKKNIITISIVVIVLAAVLVSLFVFTSENDNRTPLPTPTPEPTFLTVGFSEVTSIDYTPRMGMAYTIAITLDDEGNETAALTPGRDGFDYQQTAMLNSVQAAVKLEGIIPLLNDVPDDELADFGFDEPLLRWTIHAGEQLYSLELGDPAGGGDSVYLRMADGNDIYLLPFDAGRPFARAEHEFRHLQFIPPYDSRHEALQALNYFNIQGTRTPFALRRMSEEEAETAPLMAMYQFTEPTTMFIESHYLNDLLFESFFTLGFNAVVEDDPEDLVIYGLDDPYKITVRDAHGWDATLLVGDPHEFGGRYVMLQDKPTVFHDRSGDFSILDIDYTILINRLFWLHEIVDVEQVEWNLGDTHRVIEYDEDIDTDARRIYEATLLISIHDRIDDDVPRGEHYGSITINLRDGRREELAFYYITERIFNAQLNGLDLGLTVHRNTIDDLRNRL